MTHGDAWALIDKHYPKHQMNPLTHHMIWKDVDGGYCSDDEPNGSGNFGCKRCDAIMYVEKEGHMKIWPRIPDGCLAVDEDEHL